LPHSNKATRSNRLRNSGLAGTHTQKGSNTFLEKVQCGGWNPHRNLLVKHPSTAGLPRLILNWRACVFRKWLKMVFIPLLGFGGSFKVQIYFSRLRSAGAPMIYHPSTGPRFAYQTSPNWTQMGKRRIKTNLDQFRNTHAR